MRRSALLIVAAGLLVAADSPKAGTARLQGRWLGGVWTCNGGWCFVVDMKDPILTLDITGETITLQKRKGVTERLSYTLDTTATPNAINLTTDAGETQLGLYEIGDSGWSRQTILRLCVSRPGADRPKGFVDNPSEGTRSYTFTPCPKAP